MASRILPRVLGLFTAVLLALVCARAAHAQGANHDIGRSFRPGPYIPYDGAPFSHRYNQPSIPYLYLNNTPQEMAVLDYLDRLDRAEKFGHLRSTKPPIFNRIQDRLRRRD